MENQIKQRVIGILVLLVLVIAIALLLFYGAKESDKNTEQQIPLSNQEIANTDKSDVELSKTEKLSVMSEAISPTPQEIIPDSKKELEVPVSSEFGKVKSANENNEVEQFKETLPSQDIEANSPVPTKVNNLEKAAPLVKSHVNSKTKSLGAKKKLAGNKDNWLVKVGVFSVPENAHSLVKKLQKQGYRAHTHLAVTNKGALTEVFIGPEKTYKDAQVILKNLHDKFHVNGIILKKHNKAKLRKIK